MGKLSQLKGLGPKSEQCLNEIGIFTPSQLRELGAVQVYTRLVKESSTKPSLNFLYALAGAIEDRHWLKIARSEKERLLAELEGYQALELVLQDELATEIRND